MRKTIRKDWLLVLMAIPIVSFYTPCKRETGNEKKVFREGVIHAVTGRLEFDHYCPKKIDDPFSKNIWTKYLTSLDNRKCIFRQEDLAHLKKYQTMIDDELHAPSTEFFDTVMTLYRERIAGIMKWYGGMLEKPFDFKVNEAIPLVQDSAAWPRNETAQKELWRKWIKYMVLKKLVALRQQQDSAREVPSKSDQQLETEARQKVLRSLDATYRYLLSSGAEEEKFGLYINVITLEADPHTSYFEPVDTKMMGEQLSHRYYGLGIKLELKDGDIIVNTILSGGPAARSGLVQNGDAILRVSDPENKMLDVFGLPISNVAMLIRGEKDTPVKLEIRKNDGNEKTVTMIRGEVIEDEAGARAAVVRQGDKKIGYIYLPEFYLDSQHPDGPHCATDVANAVKILKQEGVDGIVIDLRNDPGGSLEEVVRMVGLFVPAGPVVQLRAKEETKVLENNSTEKVLYDGPLAVMVNNGSASASEIFSAAMQDYRRAVVIGSDTYGKGTAQEAIPIGKMGDKEKGIPDISFGSMRLTKYKFYRINGATTQLKGVTPDILLPEAYDHSRQREGDNSTALPWDTIAGTVYNPMRATGCFNAVIAREIKKIAAIDAFTQIKQHSAWLKQNENRPAPLTLKGFNAWQRELDKHRDAMVKAARLLPPQMMTMEGLPASEAGDSPEATRYRKWVQSLAADRYLQQAVEVVNDIAAGNK